MINPLLNILFPARCLICNARTNSALVCTACRPAEPVKTALGRCACCFSITPTLDKNLICETCHHLTLPFNQVRYLWSYEGNIKKIIRVMKYRPSKKLSVFFGKDIGRGVIDLFSKDLGWDLIIPIPSAKRNLKERLFNQCYILSKAIEKELSSDCCLSLKALHHKGYKRSQASLKSRERLRNIANAFSANRQLLFGKKVLLVDDVITTGATVAAASRALKDAGVASIDLIALARSEGWEQHRHSVWKKFSS